MNQEKIGKLIAKLRKEKGLTQQQLGDMVGVGYRAVSKWETGLTMPDISIINELCEILGITSDELLKGELCKKEPTKTNHHKVRELLMIIIPLIIIIGIIIGIVIKQNNKVYEYDLKSANTSEYQVEGNMILKGGKLTLNINKIKFINYELKKTIIKNYEYKLLTGDKVILGVGYNLTDERLKENISISEFQNNFKIDYHDKSPASKEWLTKNKLTLEFDFIAEDNAKINEKINIILVQAIDNNKN